MADTAVLYRETREKVGSLLRGLSGEELRRPVPATPGWTIRDIVSHLAGDAECLSRGDFPAEFFRSFGDAAAIVDLNRWTENHVSSRADRSLEEVLSEWETSADLIESMMKGDKPWPDGIPFFADRVILTDLGVHLHDIYGALGIRKDREDPVVRIGAAGYVVAIGFRLGSTGLAPLRVIAGDSERSTGEGEPGATVRADRFEMFRALSGRRSPEQIAAYDWDGDPEPYIPYFYPYGVRREALVE